MLRVFLSRRWLGWHALLVAGIAVLVLLGRWQWDRAQSQVGTLQNLGYAFEWWLFACLAVYGWWREMRADARAAKVAAAGGERADQVAQHAVAATAGLGRTAAPAGRDVAVHRSEVGPEVGPEVRPEVDEEVAAYNAYLSRLNARYARQRH